MFQYLPPFFLDSYERVISFMDAGGQVLWAIGWLVVIMWALIFERIWYMNVGRIRDMRKTINVWKERKDHNSWHARRIREMMISQTRSQINRFIGFIKTCVALCPLLGLLGTVLGMIEVFEVMAVTGGGDARSMAGGVRKATLPTFSGMVSALSGIFAMVYLERKVSRNSQLIEDRLAYN